MKFVFIILAAITILLCGCQKAPSSQGGQEIQTAESASEAEDILNARQLTGRAPITDSHNILANPGFENGLFGWKWLDWSKGWAPFSLSDNHAYEGTQSLFLPVLSTDRRQTIVWGGVQEITLPDEIPECIEGYYFVENWSKGDWKQYLQLVVIDLSHDLGPNQGQAQLRYIISGSTTPPLSISNAQYLFIEKERRETPVIGKWTHFSVNPKEDFIKSWNYVPQKDATLRILFEGRFDYHNTETPARADVYFDNLYFGPRTATRCAH